MCIYLFIIFFLDIIFAITLCIVSTDFVDGYKLVIVHFIVSASYVIDEGLGDDMMYIYIYIGVCLVLFFYYLIYPILRFPYGRQDLPYCMQNKCGLIFGLLIFAVLYCISFLLFQQMGSLLCHGTIFHRKVFKNGGVIPILFSVIISWIAWFIILCIESPKISQIQQTNANEVTYQLNNDLTFNKNGPLSGKINYVAMSDDGNL